MKNFTSRALKIIDSKLSLIDQTRLPQEELWIAINDITILEEAIISLRVRGAPLIAIAAVCFLELQREKNISHSELSTLAQRLEQTRPTAVNLKLCIERFMAGESAEKILEEDVELCRRIGGHGADLIRTGDGVLTHCNTGELATAGIGTALGVIQTAHLKGRQIHVYVDETRPLLQGGRLTAWELVKANIPHTLICDNMAGSLMRAGRVQAVVVGADRIALNGDFANKVGTYPLSILAQYHKIPFYVCAPYTTVDPKLQTGADIEIEIRKPEEVRGAHGAFGKVQWAPLQSPVHNPAFDVTPAELVTAWILDHGVYTIEKVKAGALKRTSI